MFESIKNAWGIVSLRKKIIYTVIILILVRLGTGILLPYMDPVAVKDLIANESANPFQTLNMITGGRLGYTTLFALGVTPYINATIILQLMAVVIPALEQMMKEGEAGRQRHERITRYTTFGLAFLQGIAYFFYMRNQGFLNSEMTLGLQWLTGITLVLLLVAGSAITIWLGEQVTQKGIGNGISILIFGGILANIPSMFYGLYMGFQTALQTGATRQIIGAPVLFVLYFVMIIFVIYYTQAERRIPIEYSKRQVGRKMYGGQSSYLPFKVNMSGVLPVIFASSFLAIPTMIKVFFQPNADGIFAQILSWFDSNSILYAVLYFVLVFAFNYFYTTVQSNPIEIANNLRKANGSIRGIRPGKPTSDYIRKVVSRITLMGGLFLGATAVLPIILGWIAGINFSMGGTSVIILVGVAIETVRAIESQMTMRHYKGFLD